MHSPQQYDIIVNGHCDSGDHIWPRGQAVKTSPFHGGNTGSIPVGVIKNIIWRHSQAVRHGSATPLSSVRFRLSPLKIEGFRFFLKSFVVFVIRKKQKRQ